MNYRAISLANSFAQATARYTEYGYGWRFSGAWSVQTATSDCACLGGGTIARCHIPLER